MAGKKFEFSTRPLGDILVTDFMTPKKMGSEQLAESLNIDVETCEALLAGKASLTGDVALQLSELFDKIPEYWMKIQSDRDLEEAQWRQFQKKTRYYFLHIKKCVGTTLIGLARNQENVQFHHPDANGNPAHDNPELSGENRYIRYWEFSKKKQKEFLFDEGYNFIANEVHLGDEFDHHPSLVYFTILRDPVKRALSQFYHMRHLNDKINSDVNKFLKEQSGKAKVFNNYMAFQITGKVVKNYNKEVAEEAIRRLEKFDHILFQETFAEDIAEFVDYGWDINLMSDRNVRSTKQKDTSTDETLEKLSGSLGTDQAIYDHFWKKRQAAKKKAKKANGFASSQPHISSNTLFYKDKWDEKFNALEEIQKAQKKTNMELRQRISDQHVKFKEKSKQGVAKQERIKALHEENKELRQQITDMKI